MFDEGTLPPLGISATWFRKLLSMARFFSLAKLGFAKILLRGVGKATSLSFGLVISNGRQKRHQNFGRVEALAAVELGCTVTMLFLGKSIGMMRVLVATVN